MDHLQWYRGGFRETGKRDDTVLQAAVTIPVPEEQGGGDYWKLEVPLIGAGDFGCGT